VPAVKGITFKYLGTKRFKGVPVYRYSWRAHFVLRKNVSTGANVSRDGTPARS
jgi:hypothetical protein